MKRSLTNAFVRTENPQRLSQTVADLETDDEAKERIVVGYGPAGRGKTSAGIWLAGEEPVRRVYVRARQVWNTLKMLQDIGAALGRRDMPSVAGKGYDALLERIEATSRMTLIIDEANYLKSMTLNVLRDVHDEAGVTLVFLGEQRIKDELERHRRLKSRVAAWVPFAALQEKEAPLVARKLLPQEVGIEEEAVKALLSQAGGVFRDYVNLLRAALRQATANNQNQITLATARTLGRLLRAV